MKKILLFNLIIVIFILSLIEIVIRLSINISPQGISEGVINTSINPMYNFPNVNGKKVFGKKVFTDKFGNRISKEDLIKDEKKLKNIYFIGGSVTFGSGVEQKNTFSGILNKKFENYNIINSSVIGSNLINNLKILNQIEKKNLDKIFINLSLDDLDGLEKLIDENRKEDNQKNNQEIHDEVKNDFISKLKNNVYLNHINKFIRSKSVTYVWFKGFFLNSEESYYNYSLNNFKKKENQINFRKILKKISYLNNNELNNKIIFIVIPYSYQISDRNCKFQDFAEQKIDEYFLENKIKLIKFKKIFCNIRDKKNLYFKFDPSHLSKYGHKIVARQLKGEIN